MADQTFKNGGHIFGLTNVMAKRLILVLGFWFQLSFSIGQLKLLAAR